MSAWLRPRRRAQEQGQGRPPQPHRDRRRGKESLSTKLLHVQTIQDVRKLLEQRKIFCVSKVSSDNENMLLPILGPKIYGPF